MPRYNYECGLCGVTENYRLAMDQKPEACVSCNISGSLSRIFGGSTFILKNTKAVENNQPAGVLTKEYIEENRKILEQQKSEAGSEEYDQT